MMAVDMGAIVRDLAIATARRLEAAKRLPETVARVKRTVGQVVGATQDIQMDRPTENALATIQIKLQEVNGCLDRLEKTGDRAAGKRMTVLGRCCGMLSSGQDILSVEEEFDRLDEEIRAELTELVKATQLHAYANRAAGVLKDKSSRAFWDRHFKDARSVPGDELLEALRHEAGSSVDMDALEPIVRCALGCDGDGQQQVTVLKFGETFGANSLTETLQQLATRRSAATHLVQLRMYRLPSKKADDANSLALLVRATDSLADLRHAVRKHAAEAVEEEGEGAVAALLVEGSFEVYLDKATTRVRRKQEAEMSGKTYLDRACLVPSIDVPGAKKAFDAARAATRMRAAGGSSDDTSSEAGGSEDGYSAAARIMEQSDARHAVTLSVDSALAEPKLTLSLRAHAARLGIGEAAVAFLLSLRELTSACAAVAPSNVNSGARTRLATIGCEALAVRYLREPHAKRLPPDCESAIAASTAAKDAAAGDATALLSAFEPVRTALETALAPALDALRHETARQRVRALRPASGGGVRARVVVVGGGYAGGVIAADLCGEPDKFDVVLIDPKEYFEDVTANPRALCNPGTAYTGAEDTSSEWANSVCLYKDFVIRNGELVNGTLTGVRTTHVEVGAARTVVPYDYLVLATGSSYASDIKANNASIAFRHEQLVAERDAIDAAKQILVVGGGLVGCEVAGEVAEAFPGKQVTLVHAHESLLPNIRGAHVLASGVLESLGVKLLLGHRLSKSDTAGAVAGGAGAFITSKGTRIEADKVFWCTGYTPNSQCLRDHDVSDPPFGRALDERGFIRVDASLRVLGLDNVFACGDVVSSASRCAVFATISDGVGGGEARPERTAAAAGYHGAVVTENIRRLHGGCGESEVVRFDYRRMGNKANVAVSLGKSMGIIATDPGSFAMYESFGLIGADFGADKDKIESDWISLAGGVTGFKATITAMIVSSRKSQAGFDQVAGMGKMVPCFVDPRVQENREAWAGAVELETIEELDDDVFAPAAAPAGAGVAPSDHGAGVGAGGPKGGGPGDKAETMTIGSDASAHEIQSLRSELRRKETRSKGHEQEVVALRAELEAAKAIASVQMEEMRARMHEEQQAVLSAMRAEMESAAQRTSSSAAAPPLAQALGHGQAPAGWPGAVGPGVMTPMGGLMPMQVPDEDAGGTAGVAMASAQMLLAQASAAANVIAALAATVRNMEDGKGRQHDPASP